MDLDSRVHALERIATAMRVRELLKKARVNFSLREKKIEYNIRIKLNREIHEYSPLPGELKTLRLHPKMLTPFESEFIKTKLGLTIQYD
jgi:hypothetical protein